MAKESSKKLSGGSARVMGRGPGREMEDLILRAVERVGEEELGGQVGGLSKSMMGDQQKRRGTRNKANRYLYKLSTKNWSW